MKLANLIEAKWAQFLNELFKRFNENDVAAMGAQTTYYLIISFFPFLIFLITLISYTPIITHESLTTLAQFLPLETYQFVMGILSEVLESRSITLLSFGMITTLWTASNGIAALIKGINKSSGQKESRSFIKVRCLSILFTFALILLMIAVLLLLVLGKTIALFIVNLLGISHYFISIWNVIRYVSALLVMCFIFSSLYLYGPVVRLRFQEVIPGAIFATLGWVVISNGFSKYIDNFGSYTKMYGSIGGIFVLLLWLYLSSVILLLGAEINSILLIRNSSNNLNEGYKKTSSS